MPARRVRPDRPLTAAERQARYRSRYNVMDTALWYIAERATSIAEARTAAAQALKGHVDWNAIHTPPSDVSLTNSIETHRLDGSDA
jgi:hypothetical protein